VQTVDVAGDRRWELGVEWEPMSATFVEPSAHVCEVDAYTSGWPLVPRQGEGEQDAVGFVVIGSYSCGAASRPPDEAAERATNHLIAIEERAVEWAITTGAVGNRPSLQGATDLTPAGGAVDLPDGFGILEAHLATEHHSPGVIHGPRRLAAPASSTGSLLRRESQRLETLVGNFVALGGGYEIANVGPAGTPPGDDEAWLYATARPTVRRSSPFLLPDEDHWLDRSDNQVRIYAARVYVVGWDPVAAAVLVDAPARPA
jgi:hypothetical protein